SGGERDHAAVLGLAAPGGLGPGLLGAEPLHQRGEPRRAAVVGVGGRAEQRGLQVVGVQHGQGEVGVLGGGIGPGGGGYGEQGGREQRGGGGAAQRGKGHVLTLVGRKTITRALSVPNSRLRPSAAEDVEG